MHASRTGAKLVGGKASKLVGRQSTAPDLGISNADAQQAHERDERARLDDVSLVFAVFRDGSERGGRTTLRFLRALLEQRHQRLYSAGVGDSVACHTHMLFIRTNLPLEGVPLRKRVGRARLPCSGRLKAMLASVAAP